MRKAIHKPLAVVERESERLGADDISDLPDEVLNELRMPQADMLGRQVLAVMQALGGSADLDRILIALFRKFQVVVKRRFLQNKLWRMIRKGQIQKVKGARGIFRVAQSAGAPPLRRRKR